MTKININKLEKNKAKILELLEQSKDILENNSDRINDYVDERSDKWQESDIFDQYSSWSDELLEKAYELDDLFSQMEDIDYESLSTYEYY